MRVGLSLMSALTLGSCSAPPTLQDIQKQAALDAEKQYEMTARSGTPIDKCVRAGLVAESYLQATDEVQYQHWKVIQRLDCSTAGVPI